MTERKTVGVAFRVGRPDTPKEQLKFFQKTRVSWGMLGGATAITYAWGYNNATGESFFPPPINVICQLAHCDWRAKVDRYYKSGLRFSNGRG